VGGTTSAPAKRMLWSAIALFVISYGCILLLPMWRRRQAKASREIPGGVAPPLAADELKRRLRALTLEHPELEVTVAGEMVQVSWNLDLEQLRANPDESSKVPTYRLELQIEDGEAVNVRYAQGEIRWEALGEDPSRVEPSIVWNWPMEGIGGGEVDSTPSDPGHGDKDMHRSVGHLVQIVRTCAFEAGYAWQPVIEMVPTPSAVNESSASDGASTAPAESAPRTRSRVGA